MSRLRLATLLALPALAYACANTNGEGPGSGRGGAPSSGSGGQGGSSASGGSSAPGGSGEAGGSGVAGTTGQAPGGMGGETGAGGSGAGDGTGGDGAGGGAAGTAGVDPRCPTAAPVGGPTCRIPDDAGAFCLYGTMMCVCGATGQTTGMWQCFGGGDAGASGGGGVTGTGGGGGGTTGAAGTTGTGRGGAGGTAPATPCPASLPSGGSCTPEGKLCSYGTAPRPECRDKATCTGGKWVAATAGCPAPLSTGCPATAPDAAQTVSCTAAMVDGYCRYTAGNGVECRCVGNASTGGVLVCNRPTAPPAPCPAMLPNAGTSCGTATQSCAYPCAGQLSSVAVTASCSGGTWSWVQSGCVAP